MGIILSRTLAVKPSPPRFVVDSVRWLQFRTRIRCALIVERGVRVRESAIRMMLLLVWARGLWTSPRLWIAREPRSVTVHSKSM